MKNSNKFKKILSIAVAFAIAFSSTVVFADDSYNAKVNNGMDAAYIAELAAGYVEARWKYGADLQELYFEALKKILDENPELLDTALKGMFSALDEHSVYYNAEEYKLLLDSLNSQMCGIGVTIMQFDDGLNVVSVTKNSPAEKAGIIKGDVIISADGVDIRQMDFDIAKQYITGDEGTEVTIGFVRDDQQMSVTITREIITVESGFYQILDEKIGYIGLYSFDTNSPEFVAEALAKFDYEGITDVILDLRSNPGGALLSLVEIANMFIPEGPVIQIEYKNNIFNETFSSSLKETKYNLAVLVNEYSASASEAFSGAVQDSKSGIVIGTQTHGKGTMQNVFKIVSGGGIKLTEAEYLTRDGRNINGVGITPDEYIENREVKYDDRYYGTKISFDRVLKTGDTGDDVFALEQRLSALGYSIGVPDKIYGEDTFYAVKRFQESTGLYPYGVLDITTQLEVLNQLQTKKVILDDQLEYAIDYFKSDK